MRSILKKPRWYRWRQCQRSASWRFSRILLFIVQLAFLHRNNEPGWPVDPTAPTSPSTEDTMGREPVVWEGAGPPPVPESLRQYAQQQQQLLGTGTDGRPVELRGRVVPGGGPEKPGTTVASAGGGKPADPTEVGTVRGAGGPAASPEGTARPAEPPAVENPAISAKALRPSSYADPNTTLLGKIAKRVEL